MQPTPSCPARWTPPQGQLLRTNKAALNAESAAQVASEAGWGKPAQKDLAAAGKGQ